MSNRIQVRRDTAANWTTTNPVLAAGEPALETDTGRRKTGDGTTAWTALPYVFDKTIADATYTTPAAANAAYAPITGSANYLAPGAVDSTVAPLIGTPTSATAGALNAAYANSHIVLHDEFSRYQNGPLAGKVPLIGPAWQTTGAAPTTIVAGRATSIDYGYAYALLSEAPATLTCEVEWANSAGGGAPMTMNWSPNGPTLDLGNLLHLNFSATSFNLTVRQDGGSFDPLLVGIWNTPMVDGEVYRVSASVQGRRITIYGPNGEIRSIADPRVALLHGGNVFWEPVTVLGSTAYLHSASAFAAAPALSAPFVQMGSGSEAGKLIDASSRIVGSRGASSEVSMGTDPTSGMPTITFGPVNVYTELSAAAALGATSIQTPVPLASGTIVQIESGNNSETVTTAAYSSGSGPYTSAISTPTTKSHSIGSAAIGTHPASRRVTMSMNLSNGYVYLPDRPVLIAPGGNLYLGNTLDAYITRHAANVVGVPSTMGFKIGRFTTAARPSASAFGEGAMIYDTDLDKPLWSTGTSWKDAMGTAV